MKRIAKAFLEALEAENLNQAQWAAKIGTAQPNVSRFVNGRTPNDFLLNKLFTAWSDPELGTRILIAHIEDELMRADVHVEELRLKLRGSEHSITGLSSLREDLVTLEEHLDFSEGLQDLIHSLAERIRRKYGSRPDSDYIDMPIYQQKSPPTLRKVAED